jgi:putative ABC transport system permease protein
MNLLTMASRNVRRNRRRTIVTVAAMSLALFVMILYSGLMTGYLIGAERNLLDLELGDIQIHAPGYLDEPSLYTVIEDYRPVLKRLRDAGLSASFRLIAAGLAAVKDASSGATFIGVDVAHDADVSRVYVSVKEGRWLDAAKPSEVVIGARMARNLNARIGSELVVLSQATDGSMANELYTVRGILKNISDSVDRGGVFMTEKAFRDLMVLPGGVHRIIVRRPFSMSLEDAKARAMAAAGGLDVKTWREIAPTLASMMDSAMGAMYGMFFIVYIAIGILILNAMLMAVFERIREFGVLKALGAGPGQVMRIILLEGFLQTGAAIIIGALAAVPGLLYLNRVGIDMSGIGALSIQGIVWDPVWRAHISGATFTGPILTLVFVVGAALLYPAAKAAMLSPIKAIYHR